MRSTSHPGPTAAVLCFVLAGAMLLLPLASGASISEDLALSGYARAYALLWQSPPHAPGGAPSATGDLSTGLLHLRQNLRWYVSSPITVALETKERVFGGGDAGSLAGLVVQPARRPPYFDWTATESGDHYRAEATIDRLWADLTTGPVETRLGRQRIAWGTNLVWNPIDIFNPSSVLDFDDEEKPGTDAARVEWYVGPASELDVAWAPGRVSADTDAAARFKLNRWGYDWMLLGGRRGPDEVVGLAWSGSIAGGGFRGEALAGRPRGDSPDTEYLNASVSGDYSFPNTFYVQASVLYQSRGVTGDAGGPALLQSYARNDLSPARWSLFGEVARDLNPLWHVDLSAIANPLDGSFYVGPTLRWSATPNLDVAAQGLLFYGRGGTEFGGQGRIWMLRAQYSY